MNEQEKAIQEVFEAIIYQVTTERHKSAALTMISLYAKKGRDLLSSPPAKEPLTDEQLQKETQVLYPTQTNFFGQNIQSQYNELRQEGYIKGRKASEALLKEKENYIQKQQEAINWAAKIMDEKDAEIERLKEAASAPVPYIECEDKEVRERAIDYAAGAGSNRECDIAYNAYLAGEHDGRIAQTKSNYGESATIKELNQQLTELKEENERLKGEVQNWQSLHGEKMKSVESLFTLASQRTKELSDLRALHTQQMEEAWDAAELYRSYQGFIENNIKWPIAIPPNKSTYINKITGK